MADSAETFNPDTAVTTRRYDIDWLRVILFALLIWFHYLTLNQQFNERVAGVEPLHAAYDVMHQWRLPALFAISGMGTAFAFKRRTWQAYLKERATRLLIPLLFTTYVINWGLMTAFETTRQLLNIFQSTAVTWHMWFVYNLWIYSVILTPLFFVVRRHPHGRLMRAVRAALNTRYGLGILLIPPAILALALFLFKPWMPGEVGTQWEFLWYLLFFLFGYFLITAGEMYFTVLDRIRLPVTILTPLLILLFRTGQEAFGVPDLMAGGWVQQGYPAFSSATALGALIQAFHVWFWCLMIFSWAARLLNRPSRVLTYLNQAIYPVYIVHMDLLWIVVALLSMLSLNIFLDGLLLGPLLIALIGLFIFEIVKRGRVARLLFGIKSLPGERGAWNLTTILFDLLSLGLVIALVRAVWWSHQYLRGLGYF